MNGTRHKIVISLLLLCISGMLQAQSSRKRYGNGTRVYLGPVLGFYRINSNHAINPSAKMSATFGFKREQKVGNDFKTCVLFGANYFFHGLNFRSYYFNPDTFKIYDKSFGYNYSLFIHEINVPLQVKYLFKRQDNSLFSPYVIAGYHLRYLLPGRLTIRQDGNQVRAEQVELKFKTPLLVDQLNSFVSLGAGWQKNSLSSSKSSFYVELNFRYGFSSFYFESDYAASSLYINATHLCLELGLKF